MFRNFNTDRFGRTRFEIKDVDVSLVNAIRRLILTDIPVVGFQGEGHSDLSILENNGPLHNEIMLHRFGLIPICMDEGETEAFNTDDYDFALSCTNTNSAMKNVTSHDITITKNGKPMKSADVARIFPASAITKDHILITRLRTGETLRVEGKAIKSTARFHAGFSPVSLCTYHFVQDPVEAAKAVGILDKERKYLQNEYGDPTLYQFEIECEAGLSVRYLFDKALEILMEKINKVIIESAIATSEYLTIAPAANDVGYEFTFKGEDDTLGSFIQSYMYSHYIRNPAQNLNSANKPVTYVGYYCPHPLDHTMVLKICIAPSSPSAPPATESDYIDVVTEQCRRLLVYLQEVKGEWGRAAPGSVA